MNRLLDKLFLKQDLTFDESFQLFDAMVQGELNDITTSAILTALKMKGETPEEVSGAASALRHRALPFAVENRLTADCCGTGGSGLHTLNISTLVALICAELGLAVVKHGNRSVSSQCGSADVLEALGVNIKMSAQTARLCLEQTNLTFLFAPSYHPSIKHVMPVRNQLKTRTLFNLLGPLLNPARPQFQLMGVYAPEYCRAAAESLKLSGCKRAMVVHSQGCDEITLAGPTFVAELNQGTIREYQLNPEDFGFDPVALDKITGSSREANIASFVTLLKGKADHAINQCVAANAGALLYTAGKAQSLAEGAQAALAVVHSGAAFNRLLALAEISQIKGVQHD